MSESETLMNLLLQYENLEVAEKDIHEQRRIIGERLKAEMERQGATESPMLAHGKIKLAKRMNWSFSSAVDDAKAKVAALCAEEKQTGVATSTSLPYLTYKKKK